MPVVEDCFPDSGVLSIDDYENGGWMCTIKDSYFHSYSMVFTGDWSFLDKATGAHSVLMIFFAFTIGILLLNIIIALISNVFTEVEQNGQRAFWLKRLRFINELQSLKALLDFLPLEIRNNLDDRTSKAAEDISRGERKNHGDEDYDIVRSEAEGPSVRDEDSTDDNHDDRSVPMTFERVSLTRIRSNVIGNWGPQEKSFFEWYTYTAGLLMNHQYLLF